MCLDATGNTGGNLMGALIEKSLKMYGLLKRFLLYSNFATVPIKKIEEPSQSPARLIRYLSLSFEAQRGDVKVP